MHFFSRIKKSILLHYEDKNFTSHSGPCGPLSHRLRWSLCQNSNHGTAERTPGLHRSAHEERPVALHRRQRPRPGCKRNLPQGYEARQLRIPRQRQEGRRHQVHQGQGRKDLLHSHCRKDSRSAGSMPCQGQQLSQFRFIHKLSYKTAIPKNGIAFFFVNRVNTKRLPEGSLLSLIKSVAIWRATSNVYSCVII